MKTRYWYSEQRGVRLITVEYVSSRALAGRQEHVPPLLGCVLQIWGDTGEMWGDLPLLGSRAERHCARGAPDEAPDAALPLKLIRVGDGQLGGEGEHKPTRAWCELIDGLAN